MDPLTGFSAAGTIIQFVDFSTKLLSSGIELYKSSRGSLEANEEMGLTTADLKSVVKKLRSTAAPVIQDGEAVDTLQSVDEDVQSLRDFRKICNQAEKIAEELIAKLEGLRVKHGGNHKLESMKAAIKTTWSKDEIKSLAQRLSILRESLDSHTISMIWQVLCTQ